MWKPLQDYLMFLVLSLVFIQENINVNIQLFLK